MREQSVKDAHFRQRFDKAFLRHRHIRTGRGVTYSSSSLIKVFGDTGYTRTWSKEASRLWRFIN